MLPHVRDRAARGRRGLADRRHRRRVPRQQGRRDALARMWLRRRARRRICARSASALELVSSLPQAEQEGLETVVGAVAVAAVTFMIVWMRRNARGLRGGLRGRARPGARRGLDGRARRDGVLRGDPRRASRPPCSCSPRSTRDEPGRRAGSRRGPGRVAAAAIGWGLYRGGVRHRPRAVLPRDRASCSCSSPRAWSRPPSTRRTRRAGSASCRTQAFDLRWLVAARHASLVRCSPGCSVSAAPDRRRGARLPGVRDPDGLSSSSGRDAARAGAPGAARRPPPPGPARRLAALLAGCGGGGAARRAAARRGRARPVQADRRRLRPGRARRSGGPATFEVVNGGAAGVTRVRGPRRRPILGEVENLALGSPAASRSR